MSKADLGGSSCFGPSRGEYEFGVMRIMFDRWKDSSSLATLVLASGLTTAAMVAPADAGDWQTYKQPVASHQYDWNGLYLGAHIGGAQANFGGIYQSTDSAVFPDQLDLASIMAGGHVGLNLHRGRIVVGVEADVSAMDLNDVVRAGSSSEAIGAEMNLLASVRGRLGITVGDDHRGLVYATAGAAWTDAEATVFEDGVGATSITNFDFSDVGAVYGGGFEFAVSERFRIRGEGLYYDFDDQQAIVDNESNPGDNIALQDAWAVRVGGSLYLTGRDKPVSYKPKAMK